MGYKLKLCLNNVNFDLAIQFKQSCSVVLINMNNGQLTLFKPVESKYAHNFFCRIIDKWSKEAFYTFVSVSSTLLITTV